MPRTSRIVYLDLTHLGRHVTGLERIAIELFEKRTFPGVELRTVRARGLLQLIVKQQLLFPLLALIHPRATFVFPGFPPSPVMSLWPGRVVHYVHDLFLIERRAELSGKARWYMAWPFALAVRRLKRFFTNSQKTAAELRPYVRPDAMIELYRPAVANVFDLASTGRAERQREPGCLDLVALGTVEPRKNYAYAARIVRALRARGLPHATLHIIGRTGWGDAAAAVAGAAGVIVHGYLDTADARRIIESADAYLCTSHDEGLGLPLLEVQFAGLPVIAPDKPVFREVLGHSGTFVPCDDAEAAAASICCMMEDARWRTSAAEAAKANLARWNEAAEIDRDRVGALLGGDGSARIEGDPLPARP